MCVRITGLPQRLIIFSPVAVQVKTSPLSEVEYALLQGENAHVNGISEAIGATATETIFFFYFEGPNRGPAEASHVDVVDVSFRNSALQQLDGLLEGVDLPAFPRRHRGPRMRKPT